MSKHSTLHDTFTVERVYSATPARVYAAWADKTSKARWFSCHANYELDFRVGGHESNRGKAPDGKEYTYNARFHNIVPENRIVYSYDMTCDDTPISCSLVSVEIHPADNGSKLIFTEQTVYLDGHATPEPRLHGTEEGLDRLRDELARQE